MTVTIASQSAPLTARRVHRMSALVLGTFGALHLANHWLTPWGPGGHMAVQRVLRWFYQNPVCEPLLLLGIVCQAVTGVMLWRETRPRGGMTQSRLRKYRRWSGGYLTFFLVAHTSAALIQRFVIGFDSNFYWAAAVLRWPLVAWFVPYYSLGILSFFVHVGAAVWPKRVNTFALVGGLSCVVIIGGLAGWFTSFELPAEYR
jgi:hypothetical protein